MAVMNQETLSAKTITEDFLKRVTLEPFKDQYQDEYGNFVCGTVLKTNESVYLVGHINEALGVCDDCNIKDETILEIGHISELLRF